MTSERFTTDTMKYWNQIITELSNTEGIESDECRFQYVEVGQLWSHGFSMTQLEEHRNSLKLAIWNAQYDGNRFDKGIYNLDRPPLPPGKWH